MKNEEIVMQHKGRELRIPMSLYRAIASVHKEFGAAMERVRIHKKLERVLEHGGGNWKNLLKQAMKDLGK